MNEGVLMFILFPVTNRAIYINTSDSDPSEH